MPRRSARTYRPTPPRTVAPPPVDRPEGALDGIVVRAYGKYFDVSLDGEERVLLSTPKGTLKRAAKTTDLIAVGDRVWVVDVGEGEGRIDTVLPRERVLARRARNTRDIEQVVLANPDQAVIMFALTHPEPHLRLLDRFLVMCEAQGIPAVIAVNKIDLATDYQVGADAALALLADYLPSYPVVPLSAKAEVGLDEFLGHLEGKVTVVAGPSGVGKSSVMNRIGIDLDQPIGELSASTGKGRHTTTAAQLFRIAPDTFVADTPGIRALVLHGVEPDELDECFPELRPYLGHCAYSDCSHLHEPGCAVMAAVELEEIPVKRYESYTTLRRGDVGE